MSNDQQMAEDYDRMLKAIYNEFGPIDPLRTALAISTKLSKDYPEMWAWMQGGGLDRTVLKTGWAPKP